MEKTLQFLEPAPELTDPARARVIVLPIPFEKTTSYVKGTAAGPRAIVEASTQVEFFDAELELEPCSAGIFTDWDLADARLNDLPIEDALRRIRDKTRALLARDRFILALGGEHTITVGLIDPYLEKWKDRLTVVQIDAHADLRDEYQGSPYNHACAMRRLYGRVPLVSVGVRSVDSDEYELGRRGDKVVTFYGHEIRKDPGWIEKAVAAVRTPHVYLTVDVDGLDPTVIPSVGTPEPGGLSWWDTLDFIRALAGRHTIVGADVNELCPGPMRYADFAAAKLCYKILGYSLFVRPK